MIQSMLQKCFNDRKVVSVYVDESREDYHFTGYIACVNNNEIILEHITPQGMYDGFILLKVDSIYRVDCEGKYENKVEFLYESKGQSHKKISERASLYEALLHFAKDNELLVTLEIGQTVITGVIVDFDFYNIKLNVIDEYGNIDGMTVVSSAEVDFIVVDSDNEQDLRMLSNTLH